MKQFIVTLAIVYALLCVLMFLFQRKMLYFPQPASVVPEHEQLQPVQFDAGPLPLKGWVINPGAAQALIYYGGNAEQIEQNITLFMAMNLPYRVYLVPYRGYGNNPGTPSEAALYQDALAIYDQIKPQVSGIALMGRSLGSGIATHVAARREVNTLILVTPYDSIENVAKQAYRIFPVTWLIKDRFRSWTNVEHIRAQTLIVAAGQDRVIPAARTDALAAYFEPSQLRRVTLEEAGHNDIGLFPEYSEMIRKQLVPEQ